jgi:hypothetical protein
MNNITIPPEALRERVARELYKSCQNDVPILRGPPWDDVGDDTRRNILRDADAAIDVALEEAARVAEGTTAYDDAVQKSAGCHTTGQRIAAAIRGLKSNPGSGS